VTESPIRLGPTAVTFRAGHCIRLKVTSSDFSNHDRNHNTGGDDLSNGVGDRPTGGAPLT